MPRASPPRAENNLLRIQNAIAERRRRRWPRRVLAVVTVVLMLCVWAVAGAYFYVRGKLDTIPRMAVAGLQPADAAAPQNILIVGSDSRANQSADAAEHFAAGAQLAKYGFVHQLDRRVV